MKFIHTGDLHIGKIVNEFSMLDDQKYILKEINRLALQEKVDAVIIAGDVYDRSIPPAEAVQILDEFLTGLIENGIKVLVISGNHDSAERISFVNSILEKKGLIMEGVFRGDVKSVPFSDEYGTVTFHLLPFIKPGFIRQIYGEELTSYEDSVRVAIRHIDFNQQQRNVLVTHHFVTAGGKEPDTCDSEVRISVGGTDNVDVSCFDEFDYTALGHIHGASHIGAGNVYYSGSPLKYSFSEVNHRKTVQLVELKQKGEVSVQRIDLNPVRDMRKIRGKIEDLIKEDVVSLANPEDYICAVLTNEEELNDPIGMLRNYYPNVMQVIIEKKNILPDQERISAEMMKRKSSFDLFEDFFEYVSGRTLDEDRKKVLLEIMEQAEGGEYL